MTALDAYAIGSIFSLCLLNICKYRFFTEEKLLFDILVHGVIGYVNYYVSTTDNGPAATNRSVPSIVIIDRWALVVFTVLFFAYQIGTFLWMYFVPMKERRLMLKKDKENRLKIASSFHNSRATFLDVLMRAQQTLNRN